METRAAKFRSLADSLQSQIDTKRRPMKQNATPKRLREYRSRVHDGNNLERTQQALRAIADAIDAGNLPDILSTLRTKKDIEPLVYKGSLSGGYYDFIPDPNYRDKTPAGIALQRLLEETATEETKRKQTETARKQRIRDMEDRLRFCDIDGFFPTPLPTIETMLQLADITPGMHALEPSAGIGSIADAMREAGAAVETVELRHALCDILREKGHSVHHGDFLEWKPERKYDLIMMNPPFERGQDAAHVMRAYDLLNPGGKLIAIMSVGPFYRQDKKSESFREWVSCVGGRTEKLPDDWCIGPQAFRTTGVSACLVVIDNASDQWEPLASRLILTA